MPTKAQPKKKRSYTYEYPRPMVTVDGVVFGFSGESLQLLLIKRKEAEPNGKANVFPGYWALPGGFVKLKESLDRAVAREIVEETKVKGPYLEQLYTFGEPDRDPRGRVISVAYYALVKASDHVPKHGSDAKAARWFDVNALPDKLAFDHAKIIAVGLQRIRAKVRYQPLGFELLPEKFTLSDLQRLYEAILGFVLDKRNFRRKILALELLTPLDEVRQTTRREAQLYSFDRVAYERFVKSGFNFEV